MSEELTYAEVQKHSTRKDLYLIIHGKVYNVSSFIDDHPYAPLSLSLTLHRHYQNTFLYALYLLPALYSIPPTASVPNPDHFQLTILAVVARTLFLMQAARTQRKPLKISVTPIKPM